MKKFDQGSSRFNKGGDHKFGGDKRGGSKGGFGGGATPMMYKATCSTCGQGCEVPFKPSGNKPVLCNNCFRSSDRPEARRADDRDRGFSKPSFGGDRSFSKPSFGGDRSFSKTSFDDKKMFPGVCAKCGNSCELPFKPSGDRPVLCSKCFGQENSASEAPKKEDRHLEYELKTIGIKLDEILKLLNPAISVANEGSENEEAKVVKILKIKKTSKVGAKTKTVKRATKR